MSTAARKACKRAGEKFSKAPKVGTPVEDRAANQVRPIAQPNKKSHRVGLTSKVKARLRAYGIEVN